MRRYLTNSFRMSVGFKLPIVSIFIASLLFSCSKDKDTTTTNPSPVSATWIKVYKNVILYNDVAEDSIGVFFKPSTGNVISVTGSAGQRNQMAFFYFVTMGGANAYVGAPRGLSEAVPEYLKENRPVFTMPGYGIDNWGIGEDNSSLIRKTGVTRTEFDNFVAGADWDSFNAFYKANNGGKEHQETGLDYWVSLDLNDVFLIEINNDLRMIFCITALSEEMDGYMRIDVVVEGRDDMSDNARQLMPEKG